jgi:hypothetical protein
MGQATLYFFLSQPTKAAFIAAVQSGPRSLNPSRGGPI